MSDLKLKCSKCGKVSPYYVEGTFLRPKNCHHCGGKFLPTVDEVFDRVWGPFTLIGTTLLSIALLVIFLSYPSGGNYRYLSGGTPTTECGGQFIPAILLGSTVGGAAGYGFGYFIAWTWCRLHYAPKR